MRDSRLHEQPRKQKPTAFVSARAAARELALGSPDIDALRSVTSDINAGWEAFYETFSAHAFENEEQRRAWVTALRGAIRPAVAEVSALTFKGEAVDSEINAWQQARDPFAIWEFANSQVDYRTYPADELHLLRLLDPRAWLEELDALPVPSLMWHVVWLSPIVEDAELLEELLIRAPPLLDEHGAWTRSVAAPILVRLIQTYGERIHRALSQEAFSSGQEGRVRTVAERALKAFEEDELPSSLRQFYQALLTRADGRDIAYRLLADLAPKGIVAEPKGDLARWSVDRAAFAALSAALATAGVSVGQLRSSWKKLDDERRSSENAATPEMQRLHGASRRGIDQRQGEGGRTLYAEGFPLLLGAAAILSQTPPPATEVERLWSWFEELLAGRDPGLRIATRESVLGEASKRLGAVLAMLSDPAAVWRPAYEKLEPQRRRGQFEFRYRGDGPFDQESLLLVYVGLYGCASGIDELGANESRHPRQDFFWSLYDSARRLWLTAATDNGEHKRNLVAACFAFLPELFGDALDVAVERALRAIGNDPWLVARACSYLRLNGVVPERLEQMVNQAGLDLEAALRDAHEWAAASGQKDEFPHDFQELASALAYDIESEAPPRPEDSPEARLRRHRADFERHIPWARRLLDRLSRAGCVLRRLEPLDEKAAAWLLQVHLPSSLQADFGIAEELRILAVSGWFDGRELESAQGDPTGADAVDPDLLVVANDRPDLTERLALLPGRWGQRVPWPVAGDALAPLRDQLRDQLPAFDLFDRRDPVQGRQLVGRRDLIADLSSRLVRGQTVGVFGLRKVGKSSLLSAVMETLDPAEPDRVGAEVRAFVISLDVQGIAVATLDALAQRLAEALRKRLEGAGLLNAPAAPGELIVSEATPQDGRPIEELERLLRLALARSTLPVCIILDEYDLLFEGYGGETGFLGVERLFGLLRALAQETGRVAVAVIGRDPVFVERPLAGGFTNPMLGWVVPFWLGPLGRDEAKELLTRLGRRVGLLVGPETVETAWRWSGGHPLLHRQIGSTLLEVARKREGVSPVPTDPLCEEAIGAFLNRDAVHTIVAEVKALLASRFPDALALLHDLAEVNGHGPDVALDPYDGWSGDAARVLRNFGLVFGTADHPTMAEVLRRRMARTSPERRTKGGRGSLRHGV